LKQGIALGGLAVSLALAAGPGMAASGHAATVGSRSASSACGSDREVHPADYNGDGQGDFVVGIPGANAGRGAIELVLHGHKPVVYRPGTHGLRSVPAGSRFGAVTFAVDLNQDGCSDLVVGVPDLTVDGQAQAGGVQVFFGSRHGLVAGPLITQRSSGVPGAVAEDAHFGTSLASQDWGFGITQFFVGTPGATVAGTGTGAAPLKQAGEVVSFDTNASGISTGPFRAPGIQTMTDPQAGAHYGTIANEDLVTAPDAHDGDKLETGYFEIDGVGYFGRHAGDRLGSSLSDGPSNNVADDFIGIYVGAPGHQVGTHKHAGAVVRFDWDPDDSGTPLPDATITQATPGVPGRPQTGAQFGASITTGGIDTKTQSIALLTIGVPGETVGSAKGAGAVDIDRFVLDRSNIYTSRGWLHEDRATPHVPGLPRAHEAFGAALASFPTTSSDTSPSILVIGVPLAHPAGERPVGSVDEIPFTAHGVANKHVTVLARVDGPHPGDEFGAWVE
jgi:hypothetical protein